MSPSLQRLRLLQRQAGARTPAAAQMPAPPAPGPGTAPPPPPDATCMAPRTATAGPARSDEPVFAWVEREVRHKAAGPAALAPPTAGGAASRPADQPPTASPRTVGREVLHRLLGLRERALPGHSPPRRRAADRHLPGTEIAPGLHLVEAFLPQPHPPASLSLAFARREDAVDAADLLFFDTETTGLAGGTGTRAFMIGAADWHRDPARGEGLRVRQLMMATMAAEAAMLDTFASWLGPRTVLSSYNGRCYDAPLLKTRYRLARRPDPLSALDHVDLLFPTRRRYRGSWENCRLATIERQLLRIVREDDLPGSQAPAAWLHYLRGGDAIDLRRVLDHNHQDVVTLAQLMLRLVEAEQADRLSMPAQP